MHTSTFSSSFAVNTDVKGVGQALLSAFKHFHFRNYRSHVKYIRLGPMCLENQDACTNTVVLSLGSLQIILD